ncbi:MAG: cytochrome P450 [Vicinamibacteraceae bacterium]
MASDITEIEAAATETVGARYASLLTLRKARRDPIGFLQGLAPTGDAVPFALAGQPALLLGHPAAIEDVLVTHGTRFVKPPALTRAARLLGQGLLTADAARHTARRRAIAPGFHRARMTGYGAIVAAHAGRRAAAWRDGDVVDVVDEMASLALGIAGEALFSADLAPLAGELREVLAVAVAGIDPLVALVAPRRQLRPARARLEAIVQTLIVRRLADPDPPDDLLGLLLAADGPEATPEQLLDDAITLLLASHDTIANAMAWTWGWLATQPAAAVALRAEVDAVLGAGLGAASLSADDLPRLPYTRAVLAESLRLRPPAWILARRALEDHHGPAGPIAAGTLVVMSPYLVHRDARFFADPLRFDPGRWLAANIPPRPKLAYFPFGAGRRACIGEGLAWLEGVLALATLARRWTLQSIGSPPALDARITLRPRGPMLMRLVVRRHDAA